MIIMPYHRKFLLRLSRPITIDGKKIAMAQRLERAGFCTVEVSPVPGRVHGEPNPAMTARVRPTAQGLEWISRNRRRR